MSRLGARALAGLAFLLAVLGVALFAPAWTLDYWQAWAFLAVFAVSVAAITIDLLRRDPALLERRVQAGPIAEPERAQQLIQSLASLAFLAVFVVASLDRRRGWSHVAPAIVVAGDVLVALGLAIVFAVFRANSYAAATVAVEGAQRVVATGPYAVVRHPMYAGALVMMLGVPPATGSWWALVPVPALALVIVGRLVAEERLLVLRLAGYAEYRQAVRHRLVPFVW
jgi:protein-S-isoprenylcysteine O-methyltransferase Ste14